MIIAKRSRELLEKVVQQVSHVEKLNLVTKELALAADIQNKLIPESNIKLHSFDVDMFYQPAQEVGGDYYDVIQRENGSLVVVIADVSGKGYSAALMMSNIQAIVQTLVHENSSLENLVSLLNLSINNTSVRGRFVSMILMEIDPGIKQLKYINCGHNPPLVKQSNNIIELDVATPVLGVLRDYEPEPVTISYDYNDILFAYTDGLSELYNPAGEQLGITPIIKILQQNATSSTKEINREVLNCVSNHRLDEVPHDDISFICIKQK